MTNYDEFRASYERCQQNLADLRAKAVQTVSDSAVRDAIIERLETRVKALFGVADAKCEEVRAANKTIESLQGEVFDATEKLTDVSAELDSAVQTINEDNRLYDALEAQIVGLENRYDRIADKYNGVVNRFLAFFVRDNGIFRDSFDRAVDEYLLFVNPDYSNPDLMSIVERAINLCFICSKREIGRREKEQKDSTMSMDETGNAVAVISKFLENR